MKKRKIIVLSATVLLAIVAFPLLSAAAEGGPATRDSASWVMGPSGCQMNLQYDVNQNVISSNVGPAFVPPVFCPPDPYCYEGGGLGYPGEWFCPNYDTHPPPAGGCECGDPLKWRCYYLNEQVYCNWVDCAPSYDFWCTDEGGDFATAPTSCSPPPPVPLAVAAASPDLCAGLTVVPGNITDIWTFKDCVRLISEGGTWDGISWSCNGPGERRLSLEKEIMEELGGSCTYRNTSGGKTTTVTLLCTNLGAADANGCTCGVSSGCPRGSATKSGGVCP
jgi:hypothetical protein